MRIFNFKREYKMALIITSIFLALAIIMTFAQRLKYETESKILVVQNFLENTDVYNASRFNEYLSGLLVQVISSESFYNQTLDAGTNIDRSYFSGTKGQQIKLWGKTVNARSSYDTGIITLKVYHPNPEQAENISQAVISTLKTTNNYYHSIPNVDIRVIDSPNTSRFPMQPNIIINILIGLVFGGMISWAYIYYIEQAPDKKNETMKNN